MKHFLSSIACCLAVAGSAQFPYNPDSDGDYLIGSVDLMSLLPLYGLDFYPEGTELVIDTLSWLGHELDTLDFPIDADLIILDYGDIAYTTGYVCPGYVSSESNQCYRRHFRMPDNDLTFHSWHTILISPPNEDGYPIEYTLVEVPTRRGHIFKQVSDLDGDEYWKLQTLIESNRYYWK